MNEIRTEEIRVEISSDGKVEIKVSGMKGQRNEGRYMPRRDQAP